MKTKYTTRSLIALIAVIREQANAFILSSLFDRGITDLLPAHGIVLNALFKKSPMQMSELAEAIGRKKNTVTGLIKTLEERGYCSREPDPLDARAQRVLLTEKGEAMRREQEEISNELLSRVWEGICTEEQEACLQVLRTVLGNLQRGG